MIRVQDVLLTDSLMFFVAKQNQMKETVVLGVISILSHAQVSGVFQVQAYSSWEIRGGATDNAATCGPPWGGIGPSIQHRAQAKKREQGVAQGVHL